MDEQRREKRNLEMDNVKLQPKEKKRYGTSKANSNRVPPSKEAAFKEIVEASFTCGLLRVFSCLQMLHMKTAASSQ